MRDRQQQKINEFANQKKAELKLENEIAQQKARHTAKTAATNIQKIVRGNKDKINAALLRNQSKIMARYAARQAATTIHSAIRKIYAINGLAGRVSNYGIEKTIDDIIVSKKQVTNLRDRQQEKMDELANQKKAVSRLENVISRPLIQSSIGKLLQK